ncbi:sensor histidine kinase [Peribacillus tepidiphilus]|jgi:NarL family two-component system sensor histidine kinase LiaS|uniref:sensor histidine kinase n=1 Tax=Peribacillus tepidiphilus TaxID=2652445 RepID=UPI0035B5590C
MSIVPRQLLLGILYSFCLAVLFFALYFFVFPFDDLAELWERKVMDIPFLLFVPTLSTIIGLIVGGMTGYYWRKQLKSIEDSLTEVENRREILNQDKKSIPEIESIYQKMNKLKQHVSEQIALTQKLANERAEDQEKRVQEMVSQERNRLARELHDSVSQQLFAASMMMSAITERKLEDDFEGKQLKMVEQMIHQSQLEMRALLLHLRPVPLKGKTLQEGIKELLMELSQKVPLKITWKVEDISLDKGVEDHLFRILQESVSNTLRHAKASSLEVLLICREGMIIMRVTDDGQGFEVDTSKTGSYGLQNMHERALEIGGTLKVVSVMNKGTRLEVKVPLLKKDGCND